VIVFNLPRGPRDSRDWYLDADPMEQVDYALVDFVEEHAGPSVLDLGCGLGGYTKALGERGLDCRGFDVSAEYVERARRLGVRADLFDGVRLPLEDSSLDTVAMLEVLEHLEDPRALLLEARRVARRNVLVSTPNCTQSFEGVPIEFSHMLDLDHRQFFTLDSLRELLGDVFERHVVEQSAPLDALIAQRVLPGPLRPFYRTLDRLRLTRPRYFSRLLGQGEVAT